MTKVIKTMVKASNITPLDATGNPAVKIDIDTPKPLVNQFTNIDENEESLLSMVEDTNISTHIYDILNTKYGIVAKDKGLTIATLNNWVVSKLPSLDDTDIDVIQNGGTTQLYYLAERLIDSYMTPRQIRTGVLLGTPTLNLNLIGESNHAKTTRSR